MQIDDDLLLKVGLIAAAVEAHDGADLVSELISAKLLAVGFEIEPLASAAELLRPIADAADVARAKAAVRIN